MTPKCQRLCSRIFLLCGREGKIHEIFAKAFTNGQGLRSSGSQWLSQCRSERWRNSGCRQSSRKPLPRLEENILASPGMPRPMAAPGSGISKIPESCPSPLNLLERTSCPKLQSVDSSAEEGDRQAILQCLFLQEQVSPGRNVPDATQRLPSDLRIFRHLT